MRHKEEILCSERSEALASQRYFCHHPPSSPDALAPPPARIPTLLWVLGTARGLFPIARDHATVRRRTCAPLFVARDMKNSFPQMIL